MPAWERYADRHPTELEMALWEQWPEAGIGVLCGNLIAAIDIDVLDPEQAYQACQITESCLGLTPAKRVGAHPKCLLVYRAAQPVRSVSFGSFDILGTGRQFVAYGIHPVTQAPYSWPQDGLADLSLDALPEITNQQVSELRIELMAAFPCEDFHMSERFHPSPDKQRPQCLRASFSEIDSAMSYIPNPSLPYNEWVRFGMAIKGALGEDGWEVFSAWSSLSSKDVPASTEKAWRSFNPERIGAGTIFFEANRQGWGGIVTDDNTHPGRAFFQELQTYD